MTKKKNLEQTSTELARRSALLATAAGLVATKTVGQAQAQTDLSQDTSSMYPPVSPGIEPSGKKVEPYTAACVQSAVRPTFDASGLFLPDMLEYNISNMCRLVQRGADEYGARLMSFPEFGLQIPSGPMSAEQWWPGLIKADGEEIERIGKAAQDAKAYVAFNAMERIDKYPSRYFLSGMIVGPNGNLISNYRKMTGLTNKTRPGDVFSEWLNEFGPESLFPVADTEIGRLACVIALDMNYPEVTRGMVLNGAEVIMNPTASAVLPEGHNFDVPIVSTMMRRVRAYENQAYVLLSNLGPYGFDPQPPFGRKQPSQVIDFLGNMLASSQTGGEEIVTATVDINALRSARTSLGSGNLLGAFQAPLFRHSYNAADFAPVDSFIDEPIQMTPDHNIVLRQTIAKLVANGTLVRPGV